MREINDNYIDHDDLLDCIFYEDLNKEIQLRLTVSEFRGQHYMGIRKWVIDIDDSWIPTKQGFTFPYNLSTTSNLFRAFCELLSKAEVLHEVVENTKYLDKPDQ